eukprot:403339621
MQQETDKYNTTRTNWRYQGDFLEQVQQKYYSNAMDDKIQNPTLNNTQLSPVQQSKLHQNNILTSSSAAKNIKQGQFMFPSLENRYSVGILNQSKTPQNTNPYNSRMKQLLMKTNNIAKNSPSQMSYSNRLREVQKNQQLEKVQLGTDKQAVQNLLLSFTDRTKLQNIEESLNENDQALKVIQDQEILSKDLNNSQRGTDPLFMQRKDSKVISESVRDQKAAKMSLSKYNLEQTSMRLTKRVTGVNFYLQDISNLSKIQIPIKKSRKTKTQKRNQTSFEQSPQKASFNKSSFLYNQVASQNSNELDKYGNNLDKTSRDPIKFMLESGRDRVLGSLERNIQYMSENLNKQTNYKKFFWTPDLNVCGFATQTEIKQTIAQWHQNKNNE